MAPLIGFTTENFIDASVFSAESLKHGIKGRDGNYDFVAEYKNTV